MTLRNLNAASDFNRGTGLLVIEVRHSNPNGDPDAESEPRTTTDGRGLISPVSFKRKLRDLVADKAGSAWAAAKNTLLLEGDDDVRTLVTTARQGAEREKEKSTAKARYEVLESRFRRRNEIAAMNALDFAAEFWDGRTCGNTFLEALSDEQEPSDASEDGGSQQEQKTKKGKKAQGSERNLEGQKAREHFIRTGCVQFGPGISVAPVEVFRATFTNKAGVQEGKDRGMAPLAWRVVEHGVYAMPFFINPCVATKAGCGWNDIRLTQFLIPHAYRLTAAVGRPHVEIIHAWYAEHKSPLGSCPDYLILDALTPIKTAGAPNEPSKSLGDYNVPQGLPTDLRARIAGIEDLCIKEWA